MGEILARHLCAQKTADCGIEDKKRKSFRENKLIPLCYNTYTKVRLQQSAAGRLLNRMDPKTEINSRIEELSNRIKALGSELEAEMAKRRAGLRYGIERGRVIFEEEILRRHRELRISLARYIVHANPLVVITAPFIYVLVIPLVLLDVFVTVYQAVCFPVYGIQKVRREDYLIFERHHLAYLNILQKINCGYCSYANGLIGYVREIASRTEQYWCPIKNAKRMIGAHERYAQFADFGDAEEFQKIFRKPNGRDEKAEQKK